MKVKTKSRRISWSHVVDSDFVKGKTRAITDEIAKNHRLYQESRLPSLLLNELFNLRRGDTALKQEIRKLFGDAEKKHSLSFSKLEAAYKSLNAWLLKNVRFKKKGDIPTPEEKNFQIFAAPLFGKDEIWFEKYVGNHCPDALLFRRSKDCLSWSIEINGGSHNGEPKGKKDSQKANFLASELAIGTFPIENEDVSFVFVNEKFTRLQKQTERLNGRSLSNLRRKIYIETISAYWNDVGFHEANSEFLPDLLELKKHEIQTLEALLRKHKRSIKMFRVEAELQKLSSLQIRKLKRSIKNRGEYEKNWKSPMKALVACS